MGIRPTSSDTMGAPVVQHIHLILALLLFVQTVSIVALVIQNRRRLRDVARERQRYAEVTHAARLSVVGEITAAIVHEVTQPLSAILSNVETAELLLQAPDPQLSAVLDILTDVRHDDLRAYDIVKGLRSLLGKRELSFERIDINRLISEVLTLIRPDAVRRGVVIETRLEAPLPPLMGDPVHLQQVLLNLIINGMEAMRDTPPSERWIELRTRSQSGGMIRIEVHDNGRGISSQNKARLFEAFFTTKTQGMGMGLALARSIVTLHGGSIWLDDSARRGTAFVFTLPLKAQPKLQRDLDPQTRPVVLH